MVKITETLENYLENFMSNKPRMNTVHISKLSLLKSTNLGEYEQDNLLDKDKTMGQFGVLPGMTSHSNYQPNLQLIPIKLDIEVEGRRLKDLFLWDKNEPYLNLESFAKILMEEHNLPAICEHEIVDGMKK